MGKRTRVHSKAVKVVQLAKNKIKKKKEKLNKMNTQLNHRQKQLALVMARTTILACTILTSQIVAFLANTGIISNLQDPDPSDVQILYSLLCCAIIIDAVINIICLICQYEFLRKLYQKLFGKIDRKIRSKCASRVKNLMTNE